MMIDENLILTEEFLLKFVKKSIETMPMFYIEKKVQIINIYSHFL